MKPDCQIIEGDCRTVLAGLPEKSVQLDSYSGAVQCMNTHFQGFHLLANICGARDMMISVCAFVLQRTKLEAYFGLGAFDAQERQDEFEATRRPLVGNLPHMKWFATLGRWCCYALIAAKVCVEKFDRVRLHLLDAYPFRISRLAAIPCYSHRVAVSFDADRTVRVDDTRTIGEHRVGDVEARE